MNKKLPVLIILSLFCSALFAQLPDTWVLKTSYPDSPSVGTFAFAAGSKTYFGTGYNILTCTNDFWEYDPSGDTWTQKASVPGGNRTGAIAFSLNGKGYVGLGSDCSFNSKNDLWEYDPTNDTWTQKANFGGAARRWAVAFTIGTKGYVTTGYDASLYKDLWCYNPANDSWTQKADFAGQARANAVAFSVGGKGYVGTGYNDTTTLLDFWQYDTLTNAWSQIANYQGTTVNGAVAFTIGSTGYVGSGSTAIGDAKNDFYAYDPTGNSWTQIASLASSRGFGSACATGGKGYLCAGRDSSNTYSRNLWQYTPTTTGIGNISEWSVSVSPNPFSHEITLKGLPAASATEVTISNLLGEVLLSDRYTPASVTIDLSSLTAGGVYFIHLSNAEKSPVSLKLIKE